VNVVVLPHDQQPDGCDIENAFAKLTWPWAIVPEHLKEKMRNWNVADEMKQPRRQTP
jgi:hypothetical protein